VRVGDPEGTISNFSWIAFAKSGCAAMAISPPSYARPGHCSRHSILALVAGHRDRPALMW
jgi:hypothetical protein